MTDQQPETAAPAEPVAGEPPAPAPPRRSTLAVVLGGALVLVVALVAGAPFWAPLLPWSAAPAGNDSALADRIDHVEAAQRQREQQLQQEIAAAKTTLQRVEQRIGSLETRPVPIANELGEIRQQLARIMATTSDLATRLDATDKTVRAQPDMAARLDALDKAVHAQGAGDAADAALILTLLQLRDAIEAGRPFAAEYEALTTLAGTRGDLATAAAPLAEAAKTGLAGRPALAGRLRELAGTIATASAPPEAADWPDQALARLRRLVTIRRIDGAGQSGPEAAVNTAELALAGGDLEGAVAALDKLTGAPAQAAQPWLRTARQRLAAETTLRRIQTLLATRLGNPAIAPSPVGNAR